MNKVELFTKEDDFIDRYYYDGKIIPNKETDFSIFVKEKFDEVEVEGAEVHSIYMSEKAYSIFKKMVERTYGKMEELGETTNGYRGTFWNATVIIKKNLNGDIIFSSKKYNYLGEI